VTGALTGDSDSGTRGFLLRRNQQGNPAVFLAALFCCVVGNRMLLTVAFNLKS
jgi:hypothetical protein